MRGKALRKHSKHEKTAASVLLKLFKVGLRKSESIKQYLYKMCDKEIEKLAVVDKKRK